MFEFDSKALSLLAILSLAPFSNGGASYYRSCGLDGTVTSAVSTSTTIEFALKVIRAWEIEDEVIGAGEPDCHRLVGEQVDVVVERSKRRKAVRRGDSVRLYRYDVDVIDRESGAWVRSIKYVFAEEGQSGPD